MSSDDEQLILQLFEDGDRALMSANVAELQRIYAEDYVQYNEAGNASTRQDVIRNLTTGSIRFLSMTSTGRRIRVVRDDVAIVHGSEDNVIEEGGEPIPVRYVYMDVMVKREGRWQIIASQLAKLP